MLKIIYYKGERKEYMKNLNNKKAVSPVITTILLVMIAVVLASIIIVWASGIFKEGASKFGKPVEQSCSDVNLLASISGNELSVINQGTIPVYKIGLYIEEEGSSDIVVLDETELSQGTARVFSDAQISSSVTKIVPILLGSMKDGTTHETQCPKSNWVAVE